uniref:Uncharacterized protein n=1 Tax=Manihot esculenta TaxID=3983 RepID=A0A2C9WBJ0_MANES
MGSQRVIISIFVGANKIWSNPPFSQSFHSSLVLGSLASSPVSSKRCTS